MIPLMKLKAGLICTKLGKRVFFFFALIQSEGAITKPQKRMPIIDVKLCKK
jgi:hypothetical protein